ncbi:DUF6585 family protein [Dactylosporangium sp. NPDC005572]|uniref:DUF6585 family protein n=1 Tax=Dactylosporangium sp. NPDC005572 TaxID=3156889 RepID=UPI0033B83C19
MELGSQLWTAPAPSLLTGPTHLHDLGVVLTTRFGTVRGTHRWSEVTNLWYDVTMRISHDRSFGSVVAQLTRVLTFDFGDGERVPVRLQEGPVRTLASDFFRDGIRSSEASAAERVAETVRNAVAAVQLPTVKAQLAAGGVVAFGTVSANSDGLRHQGQTLPWRKVSWLGFMHRYSSRPPKDQGGVLRISYDRDDNWFEVPAVEVSNLQTLEELYDSIPREPERLAVTADYEPPSRDPGAATLFLRCPACWVIGGAKSFSYRIDTATDDYRWPVEYACRCGQTTQLTQQDVVSRDSEWTCTDRGCETIFAVASGAYSVACPICRSSYRPSW